MGCLPGTPALSYPLLSISPAWAEEAFKKSGAVMSGGHCSVRVSLPGNSCHSASLFSGVLCTEQAVTLQCDAVSCVTN